MSGALVELVATGVQDAYLTGNPSVSFFRQSYNRHTNFAMRPVKLTPIGTAAANSEILVKIPNKGDLLSYVWMEVDPGDVNNLGSNTTSPTIFELYIGGQMVDRQDATYVLHLWQKFLVDSGAKSSAIYSYSSGGADKDNLAGSIFIPLHFFFCDSYHLPLVALQYHEVEIRVRFGSSAPPSSLRFYANYILLDTAERKYFIENDHEILIEQVQKIPCTPGSGKSAKFDLGLLNHPVKCLLWGDLAATEPYSNVSGVQMYLNGSELFESRMSDAYFKYTQPYYHCENYSYSHLYPEVTGSGFMEMYSFALKVSKHQPTGTCNFSRLDTAVLDFTSVNGPADRSNFNLWAVNYNILRIKNGMAGVAFSN